MIVVGPDNKLYEIKHVLDDTHLTLVEPYSGETQTDVPCRIITTYEGDLTQFSARFAALMTRMYADSKSMRGWLTALDAVTIEREDGTEVTVKPLMQIVNEHNANLEWYKENKEILDASAAGAKKSAESAAASAALDYNALSALYVEAFKEVKTEMASMKTEIEALRAEIAALKGETGTPSA